MTDKIKQARRAAFDAWFESLNHRRPDLQYSQCGHYYSEPLVDVAWNGFNAALDCVVIELPEPHFEFEGDTCGELFDSEVRAAIQSTNLGLKII